jgi:aconitate hydratase
MARINPNSFGTQKTLTVKRKGYHYHSLAELAEAGYTNVERLPFAIKLLLENLLRHEDGVNVTRESIETLLHWNPRATPEKEILFMPARVLLQDFTGVPAVADLAAMRSAVKRLGGDAARINPFTQADLVIDHSVQVESYGSSGAFAANAALEFERNQERYQFLKWGQHTFRNFRVVPPGSGIVHQVNLEYLAQLAMSSEIDGQWWVYPDSLIGTDSHTTMINGLGVLGWGVGGIEAEAALLGQPSAMLVPQVVGVRLSGQPDLGVTATDIVLSLTERLRQHGVVGMFVEFYGPGLVELSLADRATIANMAPEYGATCGLFPVDLRTTDYLRQTGRSEQAELAEAYYHAQGMWYFSGQIDAYYSEVIEFDLGSVEPCLAGPSRPQDRVPLAAVRNSFRQGLVSQIERSGRKVDQLQKECWLAEGGDYHLAPELKIKKSSESSSLFNISVPVRQPDGVAYNLCHGSVVIAAITSCTNTSNPVLMVAAGLLARNAVMRGLQVKPWVKTSFAPGSRVVTDYLTSAGLTPYLEAQRFHLVGYGCTTCIGNSGRLPDHVSNAIREGDLNVAAVLSGNRNFEGRINPLARSNYLASPPLVVAYALAGNLNMDLTTDPLGIDPNGQPVYLRDLWPSQDEIELLLLRHLSPEQFRRSYAQIFEGEERWNTLPIPEGELFQWQPNSSYIKEPPFFNNMEIAPPGLAEIHGARVLVMLGDSITTDHISPAGSIARDSPAGEYLLAHGIDARHFNSYGARRGNHEVMVRGTFANPRLRNQLAPGSEGSITRHLPDGDQMSIHAAAMKYQSEGVPLIVLGGKEYGTGSSRDWAAKGPQLLGIRAVIAESFERIHRSNLVGMGILPLQYLHNKTAANLGLSGEEIFNIEGITELKPGQRLRVQATAADGRVTTFIVTACVDTATEVEYLRHGGILPYVVRQMIKG